MYCLELRAPRQKKVGLQWARALLMSQGEKDLPFGETPDAVTFCEFTSALHETWLNLTATKDPTDLTPFLEVYLPIMERIPNMATLARDLDMDNRLGGGGRAQHNGPQAL